MKGVTIVDHPLVQHKLTLMRKKDTSIKSFRQLLKEIGGLVCYEVTRDLPLETVQIETPMQAMAAPQLAGKKLVFAPILRSGMGMLDGMLDLVPAARVAHVGLYRDPATLECVEYYFKAPADLADRSVVVIDPMLATGNTAIAAVGPAEGGRRRLHPHGLPAGLAGGDLQVPGPPPGRAHLDRGGGRAAERSRLHPAGTR